ncbi:MAG: hypothetical protein ABIC57_00650 [bacterium]
MGDPNEQSPAPSETLTIPYDFLGASTKIASERVSSFNDGAVVSCLDLSWAVLEELYEDDPILDQCYGKCDLVIITNNLEEDNSNVVAERLKKIEMFLKVGGMICSFSLNDLPQEYYDRLHKNGWLTLLINACPNGDGNQNCRAYLSRRFRD